MPRTYKRHTDGQQIELKSLGSSEDSIIPQHHVYNIYNVYNNYITVNNNYNIQGEANNQGEESDQEMPMSELEAEAEINDMRADEEIDGAHRSVQNSEEENNGMNLEYVRIRDDESVEGSGSIEVPLNRIRAGALAYSRMQDDEIENEHNALRNRAGFANDGGRTEFNVTALLSRDTRYRTMQERLQQQVRPSVGLLPRNLKLTQY